MTDTDTDTSGVRYALITPDGELTTRPLSDVLADQLAELQGAVGGYLEQITVVGRSGLTAFVNEDRDVLPPNPVALLVLAELDSAVAPSVIRGPLVLAGRDGADVVGLSPDDVARVRAIVARISQPPRAGDWRM